VLNYVLDLLIGKEISRESREVVRTSIRISLSARTIEFEGNYRAAPRLACCTRRDVVDGAVDGFSL